MHAGSFMKPLLFTFIPFVAAISGAFYLMQGLLASQLQHEYWTFLMVMIGALILMIAWHVSSVKRLVAQKTEALTDSEHQLQSIIKNMGDGMIALNERGLIQIFNPACEKMFGYRSEEVLGHNISILMPEPHRSSHDNYLSGYRKRGTSNVVGVVREFEAMHKDGSVFPIEIAITEMTLKNGILYTATIRDISTRKKQESMRRLMEEELRISQERLELGWRGAGDGMWDWDVASNVVVFSDRMKDMMGFAPDELRHHFDEWANRLHPEDKDRTLASLSAQINGEAPYDVEYRLQVKSGEWRWFRARGQAIWDNEGNPTRMAGSLIDIADRKFADSVREGLIQELTTANEQLEQFAYVASHDLREPLRTVVSFNDLLAREYGDEMNEEAKQYMSISRQAAKKMEAMVSDLLEYGRLGHDAERFTEVDCNKKLQHAIEALDESIHATHAVIHSGTLPHVIANPLRFSRLLQNLIGNAIKYQRPGNPPIITISAEHKNDLWQFAVADNGIGIPKKYLESIFAPFKRLHSDHEYSGTGIGLAICKKIVEGFGGTLWVESNVGDGSIFYFTVPTRAQM